MLKWSLKMFPSMLKTESIWIKPGAREHTFGGEPGCMLAPVTVRVVNTVLFHSQPGPGYCRGNWVSVPALGILHSWPRKGVVEYTGLISMGPNCGSPKHFSVSLQRAWNLFPLEPPTPTCSPRQNSTKVAFAVVNTFFPSLASNASWDSSA